MRWTGILLAILPLLAQGRSGEAPLRLTLGPALSATRIAFSHAGEIWDVPRGGGEARRLVTGLGRCRGPLYSPDGRLLAFTGVYDGNQDVYVVPADGGEPRRLTYHPGPDEALGWTPDGKAILFRSSRAASRDLEQLFTVPVTGGHPTRLPLPSGQEGAFSPDGKRLAYTPFGQWQPGWKHYQGGQTSRIWLAELSDSKVTPVPRENSNDRNPMWVGDTLYFLSDRSGPVTLHAWDLKSPAVRTVVPNKEGFDITSASAGPGGIVYHQLGTLKLYEFATGQSRTVPVHLAADLPELRPRFTKVDPRQVLHASLSPSGKRVLVEARGEVLSVPVEKGEARNLTSSPGVADRDPAWSPDGKWVAWFSDAPGEYALHLRAPDGLGPVRSISLGQPPSYFYAPRWSPDSKHLAYTDKRMNLWVMDVEKGTAVKVDSDLFDTPLSNLDPAWSPDSRWIVYTKQLPNHLHGVFVANLEDRKPRAITDGRSDATCGRFDRSGKYLYFLAGTDAGLSPGWLDMTGMGHPTSSNVYAAVLRKDLPSPLAPESDEEAAKAEEKKDPKADSKPEAKAKAEGKSAEPLRIDFEGLDQRIVALPVKRANHVFLEAGAEGIVYVGTAPLVLSDQDGVEANGPIPQEVARLDLKARKAERFLDGLEGGGGNYGGKITFQVSADGSKVLYAQGGRWFVVPGDKAVKPGDGALKLEGVDLWVDPRAEWRQMYREVWRIERDFLYDPGFHGVDLARLEKLYEPFLEGLGSRQELNILFEEMTGHLALGHTFVGGGDVPRQAPVGVGLLGADYRVVDGRYQFARILQGENWNPDLVAPLTQPGLNVREGEFLLAVNGRELLGTDDVYRLFQGTAGKQVVLTVGPKADGSGSRTITVVTTPSEANLRLRAWMEANRRRVDEATGGRVAYVYIPDTASEGFTNFNRYFFSQVDRQAVILDERFNHGGNIADYIVDLLKRTPQMVNVSREGREVVEPTQAIFGPKVMIINQMSGSGGDALPWLFKKAALGPLIGTRTWGGLVGIGGYPSLLDGGGVTAPRWGLHGTRGEWEVENRGIAPDIAVEQDPALMRDGRDPQLERAIQVVLELLAKTPAPTFIRPPFPVYPPVVPAHP
ncbi:MAG TPA: PDZ domain-containing protein [Holophagaceae bacterium]|nr:PDZ domain-containing protein [Holophagaceae bacterium]